MYIDVMIEKKDNYPMAFEINKLMDIKSTLRFFLYDMYFDKHLNIHRIILANTQECARFKSIKKIPFMFLEIYLFC